MKLTGYNQSGESIAAPVSHQLVNTLVTLPAVADQIVDVPLPPLLEAGDAPLLVQAVGSGQVAGSFKLELRGPLGLWDEAFATTLGIGGDDYARVHMEAVCVPPQAFLRVVNLSGVAQTVDILMGWDV